MKTNNLSETTNKVLNYLLNKSNSLNEEHKEYVISNKKSDENYHFILFLENVSKELNISISTTKRQINILGENNIIKKYPSNKGTKFWINFELLNSDENSNIPKEKADISIEEEKVLSKKKLVKKSPCSIKEEKEESPVHEESKVKEIENISIETNEVEVINNEEIPTQKIEKNKAERVPDMVFTMPPCDMSQFVNYKPKEGAIKAVDEVVNNTPIQQRQPVINTNTNILTKDQLIKLEQKYCQKNIFNIIIFEICLRIINDGTNIHYEVLSDNFFAANILIYDNNIPTEENLIFKIPIFKGDTLNINKLNEFLKQNRRLERNNILIEKTILENLNLI
jgi:hypothetical protein